jgi:hypothetical protein
MPKHMDILYKKDKVHYGFVVENPKDYAPFTGIHFLKTLNDNKNSYGTCPIEIRLPLHLYLPGEFLITYPSEAL